MSIEAPRFGLVEQVGNNEGSEYMKSYADEAVDRAVSLVKERYENSQDELENLPFHNDAHTEGVIRRTEMILSTIQAADPRLVSERDISLGRLAAAHHDTIQRWEENSVVDGMFTKVLRKRFAGVNEKESANAGIATMDEMNAREGQLIFSENDKTLLREAIEATVPAWDPLHKTIMQQNLNDESSLIARAVALADLGTAGMDGPKSFVAEGKTLFREENLDILKDIRSGHVSEEQQEYFKQRMVGWLKSQSGFVRGRQARLIIELQAVPMSARDSVTALFHKFDESILASEAMAHLAEQMSFEDLKREMGY